MDSDSEATADHASYLELRDRSGFDLSGNGETDRDPIGFAPGLSLVYTDEAHGYGNTGSGNPPPQSPLDPQPQHGNDTPNLNDAAWTDAVGDALCSDFGNGQVDNYTDLEETPPAGDVANPWRFDFDCLSFDVEEEVGEARRRAQVRRHRVQRRGDAERPGLLLGLRQRRDHQGRQGPRVTHEFSDPGVYPVKLTVTDARDGSDTDTIKVKVFENLQCGNDKVTKTGGWRTMHGGKGVERGHYCDNGGGGPPETPCRSTSRDRRSA